MSTLLNASFFSRQLLGRQWLLGKFRTPAVLVVVAVFSFFIFTVLLNGEYPKVQRKMREIEFTAGEVY